MVYATAHRLQPSTTSSNRKVQDSPRQTGQNIVHVQIVTIRVNDSRPTSRFNRSPRTDICKKKFERARAHLISPSQFPAKSHTSPKNFTSRKVKSTQPVVAEFLVLVYLRQNHQKRAAYLLTLPFLRTLLHTLFMP